MRARCVRVQRRLGGHRVRARHVRRLLRTRHVHGARVRVRARLARRALRMGHVPRPDVDGGGLKVGLVQRPRPVPGGRVPVRRGVAAARVRRKRTLASNVWRCRATAPVISRVLFVFNVYVCFISELNFSIVRMNNHRVSELNLKWTGGKTET